MEKFVLGNNNGAYILFKQRGTPIVTDKLSLCTTFESKESAEKRLNQIPKKLGSWSAIPVSTIVDFVEQNAEYVDFEVNNIYEKFYEQIMSIKSVVGNQKLLEEALNKITLITEDINHFIEFNNLNAAQGYNIYKIQHLLYLKRREIKDKLKAIDFIRTSNVTDLINGSTEIMGKRIHNRKYRIRTSEIKDIFVDGINSTVVNKVCDNIRSII